MSKLIPKYQTAWGKLEYNGPSYLNVLDKMKKEDPQAYEQLLINRYIKDNPTSEIGFHVDSDGNLIRGPKVIGMSGTDPIGEMYVSGVALNPAFKWLGDKILWGLGKMGNNWAKAKLISKEMNPTSYVAPTSILQTELIHVPKKPSYSKTSLKMLERPSKTTMKETLGLTRGERLGNNLPRTESDAVRDFTDYYTSGRNKNYFIFKDGEYKWVDKPDKTGEGAVVHMLKTPEVTTKGFIRAPYQNGVISKGLDNNSLFSFNSKFPTDWGVASNYALSRHSRNIILTSPKVDYKTSFVPETPEEQAAALKISKELSNVIDKDIVKNYWKVSSQITLPGLYTSGDAGALPLGAELMKALDKNNHLSDVSKILLLGEAKGQTRGRFGLSADSYLSILKQGNRPGNSLSFNMEDGFGRFNDSGVYNKHIYDLWKLAFNGEIPKEQFLEEFRKWVEPYGGRPAFLSKKNKRIIIPHPFIYKRKQGGHI